MKKFFLITLFLFFTLSLCFADNSFASRKDVQQFINDFSKQNLYDKNKLEKIFRKIKFSKLSLQKKQNRITHPMPWQQYKAIFITPDRIAKGIKYWQKHEKFLRQTEKEYGVPASIIVAILGIETTYGENTGDFSVIDALATLAFNFHAKTDYFRYELGEYLLLCRQYNLDPFSLHGSYTGAIGQLQFMPHSFLEFAVQADKSKPIDLMHNDKDIIASTANYLKMHGWEKGGKIAIETKATSNSLAAKFVTNSYEPNISVKDLKKHGIMPSTKVATNKKVFVFSLLENNKEKYWLGFNNLESLYHYNKNIYYGMVALILSNKIKKGINA